MKRILVAREYDVFSRILAANDYEIINLPLVETEMLDDLSEFENKLAAIENYDGIFLTSKQAAEIFRARAVNEKTNYRGKVYVLGRRSYELLKDKNLDLRFDEAANTAREMLEKVALADLKDKRFLFVRGEKSLRVVPDFLSKIAEVDEAAVYRTKNIAIETAELNRLREKFEKGGIGCACFFSPSAAESFIEQFGAETTHLTVIATIGKTTAEFFEMRNVRVAFVASKAAAEDFAAELVEYLKEDMPAKHTKRMKKEETR